MSQAYKARKKYKRWLLDQADPERKNIRNLIRKGKLPRLTILRDKGKIPSRGRYDFKEKRDREPTAAELEKERVMGRTKRGRRAFVIRMHNFIRFTSAVILGGGRWAMEQVRAIVEIYFLWAALFGVVMAASRIHTLRSTGMVRFAFVVILCSLAWPQFILSKFFL